MFRLLWIPRDSLQKPRSFTEQTHVPPWITQMNTDSTNKQCHELATLPPLYTHFLTRGGETVLNTLTLRWIYTFYIKSPFFSRAGCQGRAENRNGSHRSCLAWTASVTTEPAISLQAAVKLAEELIEGQLTTAGTHRYVEPQYDIVGHETGFGPFFTRL